MISSVGRILLFLPLLCFLLMPANLSAQPTKDPQRSKGSCSTEDMLKGNCKAKKDPRKKLTPKPSQDTLRTPIPYSAIESVPPGAKFWLYEGELSLARLSSKQRKFRLKMTGVTPHKFPSRKLASGKYTIRYEMKRHESDDVFINHKADNNDQTYIGNLPMLGRISLRGKPKGAKFSVFIDGRDQGQKMNFFLKSGSYHLVVSSPGYVPYEEFVTIKATEIHSLHFSLNPVAGKSKVSLAMNLSAVRIYQGNPSECAPQEIILLPAPRSKLLTIYDGRNPALVYLEPGEYHCLEFYLENLKTYRRLVKVEEEEARLQFEFSIAELEQRRFKPLWGEWMRRKYHQFCSAGTPNGEDYGPNCMALGLREAKHATTREPLFQSACKHGVPEACEILGWGRPDREERLRYYKQACAGGIKHACYREFTKDGDEQMRSPLELYSLSGARASRALVYNSLLGAWGSYHNSVQYLGVDVDFPLAVIPGLEFLASNSLAVTLGGTAGVGGEKGGFFWPSIKLKVYPVSRLFFSLGSRYQLGDGEWNPEVGIGFRYKTMLIIVGTEWAYDPSFSLSGPNRDSRDFTATLGVGVATGYLWSMLK